MAEAPEKPHHLRRTESDSNRENLLRFIRLEFELAETLWALSNQTENKRQRKRLRDDIRKAKVSIVHFKKKLHPQDDHDEVDDCLTRIDHFLKQGASPSAAELVFRRLQQRVRKLKNRSSRKEDKLLAGT